VERGAKNHKIPIAEASLLIVKDFLLS
jgi:hypothetical protein